MKRIIFLAFFYLTLNLCLGQTQLEMNQKVHSDFQKADKELNSVYQTILKEYKSDTAFIRNLRIAQKLWIQFRDAEMKMKYPDRESGYYGSIQPMCWSMYLKELTDERTKKLKIWLAGSEEGDVCSGSVKAKN
jgi:uncharacterized protein YecT (DUF1311 family)